MNLRQIEYALAVAETASFTRAAERCHTVQSALSHQIARLEEELGAPLFERSSRRVRLTPAGSAFLPAARQLLHAAQCVRDEVAAASGQVRGNLALGVISALPQLDVVALAAAFQRSHPRVHASIAMGLSEILLVDVLEHRLDVAFVGLWPGETLTDVQALLLAEEPLMAVVAPSHPLAMRSALTLADLAPYPQVDYFAGSRARRQTDEAFAAAGSSRRIAFEIGHVELLARLVRQGEAVGFMPTGTTAAYADLTAIALTDAPRRRVYCVWGQHPTPAAAAFVEAVRVHVAGSASPGLPSGHGSASM
ncbi:MAG TPA: LysR family transcriptional regulator [Chitinolyticbacter sp.]|nr:LysR family transcriptional regulator [Chitinolyticbacter sp.]